MDEMENEWLKAIKIYRQSENLLEEEDLNTQEKIEKILLEKNSQHKITGILGFGDPDEDISEIILNEFKNKDRSTRKLSKSIYTMEHIIYTYEMFFKKLRTPLLPASIIGKIILTDEKKKNTEICRAIVSEMPKINRSMLKHLLHTIKHLQNRLQTKALVKKWCKCIYSYSRPIATFNLNIVTDESKEKSEKLFYFLFENVNEVFDEKDE